MSAPICIAMWSGPRNISTAMMRSWENRSDTVVIDEPFYAHYLEYTGMAHPLATEIVATYDTDWQRIAKHLGTHPTSGVYYQKHITTHLLSHITFDWLHTIEHVFLIRDPVFVVASYAAKREVVSAEDLGYAQQHRLFDAIARHHGTPPLVIDSVRFLANPQAQLEALCSSLGIAFQDAMLQWPAGERDTDGLWHQHWYDTVKHSTGFQQARIEKPTLTTTQLQLVAQCKPHYDALAAFAL